MTTGILYHPWAVLMVPTAQVLPCGHKPDLVICQHPRQYRYLMDCATYIMGNASFSEHGKGLS